jgi:4'-phosphopantetheinyl transferase EntD
MPGVAPFVHLELPPFVAISSGPLLEHAPALTHAEQASITPMAPSRLAEFAQGRWHARRALAQLGTVNACLPMAADRSPVWPQGFVGSISHVPPDHALGLPGHVVAVAARATDCGGLGVDLERNARLSPEHWGSFLSARELAWLIGRPVALRNALAHGIWSAKEAAMKALRQALDPQDVEIEVTVDARTFVATCRCADNAHRVLETRLSGRLASAPGWVAALAILNKPSRTEVTLRRDP